MDIDSHMRHVFILWTVAIVSIGAVLLCPAPVAGARPPAEKAVHLFTEKGTPKGWVVCTWNEISKQAPADAQWAVDENGILTGAQNRGTWLMSEKEYGDFELDLEFKITARGNSGVALRAPMKGDPAYDGMELQIVDPRYYNGQGEPEQLCGAIYRGIAPKKDAFKPEDWNKYQITCRGPHIKVILNGELIQDFDLDEQTRGLHRDSPEKSSPPLKDRPRKGHIGFQDLGRDGRTQIRNVTLRVLDGQQ
jgi:hypothetical protein